MQDHQQQLFVDSNNKFRHEISGDFSPEWTQYISLDVYGQMSCKTSSFRLYLLGMLVTCVYTTRKVVIKAQMNSKTPKW